GLRSEQFLTYAFTGFRTMYGPYALNYIRYIENPQDTRTFPINNPELSIISKDLRGHNTVVSRLDSETLAFDKRHTVTIKAYKGAGVDFDTDLDESEASETEDITITNPSQLFKPSGEPTSITFTENADIENDYIEIVLTPSDGTFMWNSFFIYVFAGSEFRR